MYLAKVGYSISNKRRKRQGLPHSKADGTANKGLVFSCKARKLFAGGDTSAGRLETTRMMSRPLFLWVEEKNQEGRLLLKVREMSDAFQLNRDICR